MTEENAEPPDIEGEKNKRIKVTVVGDCGVGKTCMLMTFVNKEFPGEGDIPSLYENSTVKAGRQGSFEVPVTLETGGVTTELGLTDTIGSDEYRRLREVFAVNTDVFLVCFSVTDPETLDNAKQQWLTEIKILTPKAPFILVGMKTDLREDSKTIDSLKEKNKQAISIQQGIKVGKTVGAKAYVECSAINCVGIKHVFETVPFVLNQQKNEETKSKRRSNDNSVCVVS